MTFLIWSTEGCCWWKANGAGYTGNLWTAGRYTAEQANTHVSPRILTSNGRGPKDVIVVAPELDSPAFPTEEILRLPGILRARARATVALASRTASAA